MKYFKNINSLEELRKAYKELLKKYHPDNGGSVEACQDINVEYNELFTRLKISRQHYSDAGQEDREAKKWNEAEDLKIREAIYKVIHLDGLNIEVIGCWIWIDGNTLPYREELKNNGYAWSRSRKKWHYSPYEKTKYYRGKKKSFDELRGAYGSEKIKTEKKEKLA